MKKTNLLFYVFLASVLALGYNTEAESGSLIDSANESLVADVTSWKEGAEEGDNFAGTGATAYPGQIDNTYNVVIVKQPDDSDDGQTNKLDRVLKKYN